MHNKDILTGEISIGSAETRSMHDLLQMICSFREKYPYVCYDVYSAIADDIKDRIERGTLDIGLLTEPVDISKYEFIRLPKREKLGVYVRKDSPLAQKKTILPQDLVGFPLIMPKRTLVQNEWENWFGDYFDKMEVVGTYNLFLQRYHYDGQSHWPHTFL